jgi:hypothetical protein
LWKRIDLEEPSRAAESASGVLTADGLLAVKEAVEVALEDRQQEENAIHWEDRSYIIPGDLPYTRTFDPVAYAVMYRKGTVPGLGAQTVETLKEARAAYRARQGLVRLARMQLIYRLNLKKPDGSFVEPRQVPLEKTVKEYHLLWNADTRLYS